jgi:predicted RNA-binding Zn ribbon-like protein
LELRAARPDDLDRLVPLFQEMAAHYREPPLDAAATRGRLERSLFGTPPFARLLLAVERLQAQGAWPRLKACTDEDCQWAFFDTTRNRSRTWCSMEECGNKEKTRRYRQRRSG